MAGTLYNIKNGSNKLESLDDITYIGRRLLICQAHLLHQGKDDESKSLTKKTADWLEANVKINGTSQKNVTRMLSHYKYGVINPDIKDTIQEFSNSCGRLDSLDQLSTGKKHDAPKNCIISLQMGIGIFHSGPENFKNSKQKNLSNQINKTFFLREIAFLAVLNFFSVQKY